MFRFSWKAAFPLILVTGTLLAASAFGVGQVTNHMRKVTPPIQAYPAYTANYTITTVKTLSNGTTLTHVSTSVEVRDAQGRTRTESVSTPAYSSTDLRRVTVYDPTTRTRMWWDSQSKVVHESTSPVNPGLAPLCSPANSPQPVTSKDDIKTEPLGTKTLFDVLATGNRTTTTVPIGARGNDQPLVITNDIWTAPGFISSLEEHRDSPEDGTRTKELTSLTMGAPDPTLFTPPADYQVVQQPVAVVSCPNSTVPATPQPQSN
jgi:hypothetical protein